MTDATGPLEAFGGVVVGLVLLWGVCKVAEMIIRMVHR